jgi:cyclopropane fatty-acyl-phospholipid synthase-like methyltransferase
LKEVKRTLEYYNRKAKELIEKYDKAQMEEVQKFLLEHLPKGGRVLEIGFGSGRELRFLMEKGYQVWGVDGAIEFVKLARERFPQISDRFFHSFLPDLNLPSNFLNFFDAIISIAVLMHIPKKYYRKVAKNLINYLKKEGVVILSYSLTPRSEEKRFFETIKPTEVLKAFELEGFKKIDELLTDDSAIEKREIVWITEVYKYAENSRCKML